jgi:hypothetical protein
MAFSFNKPEKKKSKDVVCQDCVDLFKPTEIYLVERPDHYIFLCGPCVEARGTTGKLYKEPKTRKTKS